MLGFWIVCALLILVALIIILPSLLAEKPPPDLDYRKINRALYEQKLAELARDLDNDLIDEEQHEIARRDLQRALIDDASGRREQTLKTGNKILPALITLAIPAVAVLTYLQLDNGLPSLSPEFQVRQQTRQNAQMPSMEQAIVALEEKLKQDPTNLDGWLMLGRSYFMLERYGLAADAYAKATEITQGADADVLVNYGEARGFAMEQEFDTDTLQLFSKALRIDPNHQKGLWYAGLAAFQLKKLYRHHRLLGEIDTTGARRPATGQVRIMGLPARGQGKSRHRHYRHASGGRPDGAPIGRPGRHCGNGQRIPGGATAGWSCRYRHTLYLRACPPWSENASGTGEDDCRRPTRYRDPGR